MNLLKTLWNDEAAFLLTAELVFLTTILIIGMIVGWTKISTSAFAELLDLAHAVGNLNQSYAFTGTEHDEDDNGTAKVLSFVRGSGFEDAPDACDCDTICDIAAGVGNNGNANAAAAGGGGNNNNVANNNDAAQAG